jgi:hypothetical protein
MMFTVISYLCRATLAPVPKVPNDAISPVRAHLAQLTSWLRTTGASALV